MARPEVHVNAQTLAELQTLYEKELRYRRIFVLGHFELTDRQGCALVIDHPSGATFSIAAEAVYLKADEPGAGVGLDLVGLDPGTLADLERFINAPQGGLTREGRSESDGPAPAAQQRDTLDASQPSLHETATSGAHAQRAPRNIHERIRQLSLRERETIGRAGTLTERVALERAFGSSVWESLLQNPQLTAPEVAHIAKNGSLPVPLVSVIIGNSSWLASGEVRRALLSNPRVSGQNLERVLRACPKVDLKQLAQSSAYRNEVRSAAQKLSAK